MIKDINMKYFLFGFILIPVISGLRDVQVNIPSAIRRGDTAILTCSYDTEGDSLYSVKWYKGRREFYRYTPKEKPPMKIFNLSGMSIKRSESNETHLILHNVQPVVTGKYSCEVSADAPSFHTLIVSGDLEVVEVPENRPSINGIRPRYRPGEIVRGNCTSKNSKPAANLTWTINDNMANPSHVRQHKPLRDQKTDLETSVMGLHFVVGTQHFINGKLKLRCTARIHDVYWQVHERNIEEVLPRVISAAAASSSNSHNTVLSSQNDEFSQTDGAFNNKIDGVFAGVRGLADGVGNGGVDSDKRDTFLTHIQGDMSSLSGISRTLHSTSFFFYLLLSTTFILITNGYLLNWHQLYS